MILHEENYVTILFKGNKLIASYSYILTSKVDKSLCVDKTGFLWPAWSQVVMLFVNITGDINVVARPDTVAIT